MAVELSPRSLIENTAEFKSPPLPATSGETLTVLVHYYRGELARMAGWRDRIDRTTNWAITVVAARASPHAAPKTQGAVQSHGAAIHHSNNAPAVASPCPRIRALLRPRTAPRHRGR